MRKSGIILLLILLTHGLYAQHGVSFYHLKGATFQNTNYNPAHFPMGRLFIGLPGISGLNLYYNNRHSYSDIFKKEGNSIRPSTRSFYNQLGYQNLITGRAHVSLLHVGIRTNQGVGLSFFINERIDAEFNYPRHLMDFIIEGNANSLGDKLEIGRTALNFTHFREFGLGYAYEIPNMHLKIGARVKYYMGFFNVSTPGNFKANITTDLETFQYNVNLKNAEFRSAGIDGNFADISVTTADSARDWNSISVNSSSGGNVGSYLLASGNNGFGIDLGMEYQLNRLTTISVAITDIGYIGWKKNIQNVLINEGDTTLGWRGVDLRNAEENNVNIAKAIEDSLFRQFDITGNNKSYVTPVVPQAIGSVTYKLIGSTEVIGTAGGRMIQGNMKGLFGVGLRQYINPKMIVSGSVTRLPQQFLNIGAAFAATAGPVQFYMASDKLVGYSVPDMRSFEFRFGINLVFGTRVWQAEDEFHSGGSGKIDSGSFLGHKVNIRGHRDIYTIIDRQKRRNPKDYMPRPKKEGENLEE